MINSINYYIVIIVILLILLIFSYASKGYIYDKLLSGFYNADTDFCDEAGLDMFCLYINNDIDKSGRRSGYVLMKSDDNILLNEPTSIKLTRNIQFFNKNIIHYNIEFEDINNEDVFPRVQLLKFYPMSGKLILSCDDTIYGVFYKSGQDSEIKYIMDKQQEYSDEIEYDDDNSGDNDSDA